MHFSNSYFVNGHFWLPLEAWENTTPTETAVLTRFLNNAEYRTGKRLNPGQVFYSYRTAAGVIGIAVNTLRRILEKFTERKILTIVSNYLGSTATFNSDKLNSGKGLNISRADFANLRHTPEALQLFIFLTKNHKQGDKFNEAELVYYTGINSKSIYNALDTLQELNYINYKITKNYIDITTTENLHFTDNKAAAKAAEAAEAAKAAEAAEAAGKIARQAIATATPGNYSTAAEADTSRTGYGTFKNVFLTEQELADWQLESGSEAEAAAYIDRMSNYLKEKGKTYKDYFAALKLWRQRDSESEKKIRVEPVKSYSITDYENKLNGLNIKYKKKQH